MTNGLIEVFITVMFGCFAVVLCAGTVAVVIGVYREFIKK